MIGSKIKFIVIYISVLLIIYVKKNVIVVIK